MNIIEAVKTLKPFTHGSRERSVSPALNRVAMNQGYLVATDGRIMAVAKGPEFLEFKSGTLCAETEETITFPEWRRVDVNPESVEYELHLDRETLILVCEALTKAHAVACKRGLVKKDAAKQFQPAAYRICPNGETIHFKRENAGLGLDVTLRDLRILKEGDIPDTHIGIDPSYLLKAAKAFKGSCVRIGVQRTSNGIPGVSRALLIRGEEGVDDDLRVILMPVRLHD